MEVVVTGELDGVGVWEDVIGGPLSQGEQGLVLPMGTRVSMAGELV